MGLPLKSRMRVTDTQRKPMVQTPCVTNSSSAPGGCPSWFSGGTRSCGEDDVKKLLSVFSCLTWDLSGACGPVRWSHLRRGGCDGRLGSIMLFSCPGAWPLRCVNELGFFSPRYARGGFWRPPCARNARAPGQCFRICLFISRKVMMDFISLTRRFVIKRQILSEAIQISHHLFSLLL